MNKNDLAILTQIFNTFNLVSTQGESTRIMGKCLDALEAFILEQKEKIEEE